MSDYTIILADDHTLMREGIRNIIEAVPGLKVVGEAGDGHQLLKMMKSTIPDMVILDISMPGLRGIEAAREIKDRYPEVCILMLSMHKSQEFLAMALEAGARGYLLKEDTGDELLHAITRLRAGRTFLSTTLANTLSTDIISICRGNLASRADPLTARERQVLKLIAEGHTDRRIGELLFISLRTVQRHRYNIRTKLNLKHTADLVKYAIARGYTDCQE
ncbi:MAG: response regulator transcription factor [Desulfobacteraceae bacterium]|jgi:DNA-binding NarL/FixJ family response regulator